MSPLVQSCVRCARDITDTFVTAMYTVHSEHILGTDLIRIEIYADQMCHVNAASEAMSRYVNNIECYQPFP